MIKDGIDFKESYGDIPVPYIISWMDGKPDFTLMGDSRVRECVAKGWCSVCGQFMNIKKEIAYVGGPHDKADIESGALWFADPPMHLACAEFSMKYCPHLRKPEIREDTPEETIPDQGEYVTYICRGRVINKNGFHTRPLRLVRVLKGEDDGLGNQAAAY